MPVSTEKNFDEKFNLFKEWLTQQDNFKDKGHLITANESSIASGFSNETPTWLCAPKLYISFGLI